LARGSAQNAKGNKANNQPASAKGAGSHLRANKGHEADFDDFEPLVEPSANRDIAGVVIAVLAIASFIAVISPATAPVTAAVAGFYHLGFGLGAYVLPIVILLFAATLFLGEDSPLNVRSVAGGAVVFIAVVSILSLMVPGTSVSCDLMFTPQNLSASGGYIGAFIASALQNALGKPIAMVVLLGLVVVGLVIIGFSVGGVLRSARDRAADFAERRRADVNASPWGDDEALSVPGVARPHLSILRQKGSDAAVTTVMGNDVAGYLFALGMATRQQSCLCGLNRRLVVLVIALSELNLAIGPRRVGLTRIELRRSLALLGMAARQQRRLSALGLHRLGIGL